MIGLGLLAGDYQTKEQPVVNTPVEAKSPRKHWFLLDRTAQKEILYFGVEGEIENSAPVKEFTVKTGVPDKKPTPLPHHLGREYWLITDMAPTESPETAPYFITLDIPVSEEPPFGPMPYPECGGSCNWEIPGAFGLHGVAGVPSRLSDEDPGSSGCIRHSDADITLIYNVLKNENFPVRYYIRGV